MNNENPTMAQPRNAIMKYSRFSLYKKADMTEANDKMYRPIAVIGEQTAKTM